MNTGKKVFLGIAIVTVLILIGGVVLMSRTAEAPVPEDQIVAKNGLHWHPRLSIIIDGEKQDIPPNIGMAGTVHQELHTHDEDAKNGVIHMEMKGVVSKDETKLINFFRIWGRNFSSTTILDKTPEPEKSVKFFVSGQENTDFENYMMKDGDEMEIRYE